MEQTDAASLTISLTISTHTHIFFLSYKKHTVKLDSYSWKGAFIDQIIQL